MPRRVIAAVCLLAAVVGASRAEAHEGVHAPGFHSRVSLVQPGVPGLLAEVLGGQELLAVRNWSGKTVVLEGADGKPLVRLDRRGVWRHDGLGWRLVKRGATSHSWHDPRIHWSGPVPEETGLVTRWRIEGTADGEPFAIVGFIGYAAPPEVAGGGGLAAWAIAAAAAGGVLLLGAALALPLRRREGEDERPGPATER